VPHQAQHREQSGLLDALLGRLKYRLRCAGSTADAVRKRFGRAKERFRTVFAAMAAAPGGAVP